MIENEFQQACSYRGCYYKLYTQAGLALASTATNAYPEQKRTRDCLLPRRASAVSRVVGLLFSFSLHMQSVNRQIQSDQKQLTLGTVGAVD